MNGTLRADVGPACETVVTYFLLSVVFAVVDHLFGWRRSRALTWRVLGLFFGSPHLRRLLDIAASGHLDDRVGYGGKLQDSGVVEESLLSANLADIDLGDDSGTSLFCPLR